MKTAAQPLRNYVLRKHILFSLLFWKRASHTGSSRHPRHHTKLGVRGFSQSLSRILVSHISSRSILDTPTTPLFHSPFVVLLAATVAVALSHSLEAELPTIYAVAEAEHRDTSDFPLS